MHILLQNKLLLCKCYLPVVIKLLRQDLVGRDKQPRDLM